MPPCTIKKLDPTKPSLEEMKIMVKILFYFIFLWSLMDLTSYSFVKCKIHLIWTLTNLCQMWALWYELLAEVYGATHDIPDCMNYYPF